MLKIRLQRVGRKHVPSFRLVLTDSKNSTKSGRVKEILGSYDARKSTDLIKTDRVKYWISQGVLLTDSVHNLFVNHKVIDAKKINVLPKKTYTAPVVEKAPEPEIAPVAESTPEPEVPEEPKTEEISAEETPVEPAPETVGEETPTVEATPEEQADTTSESTPTEDAPVVESTKAE